VAAALLRAAARVRHEAAKGETTKLQVKFKEDF